MGAYVVRIRCESPYLTPWRNGTLWGRMAWAAASGAVPGWAGEDLAVWAGMGELPLVVGDAFPYDEVPVPAACLARSDGAAKRPKALPWPDWLRLCADGTWPDAPAAPAHEVERTHVSLSRETGAAIDGQLRSEVGWQPPEGVVFVAILSEEMDEAAFRALLEVLCAEGWGYGRSYGYGALALRSVERVEPPPDGAHRVALGHLHPTDDLPAEGWWRWASVPVLPHDPATRRAILPHRYAAMLAPGATFAAGDAASGGRFGRVITPDIPGHPGYAHYGVAPAWPVHLA